MIKAERELDVTHTTENWTTQKPSCFSGMTEPVAFMKDHLLEGECVGPLEPRSSDGNDMGESDEVVYVGRPARI